MSETMTEARAKWLRDRAAQKVAKTVESTKVAWGGGWLAITANMRRGEIATRCLGDLCDIGLADDAEIGVYAKVMANEIMRVKL